MTTPIVFLDTETTGVHPDRQVWEVGMIRRDDQGEREQSFFVAVNLEQADPFGLSVGRFYERHPFGQFLAGTSVAGAASGPYGGGDPDINVYDKATAAQMVARMTHGAHIVGAVPNFDTDVLGRMLRDEGVIPAWHYHLIDVENLAVGYLRGRAVEAWMHNPDLPIPPDAVSLPWKSEDLSRQLGIEPPSGEHRHTALGDAYWAMAIYDTIMRGVPALPSHVRDGVA